jgi:hypothetical protein
VQSDDSAHHDWVEQFYHIASQVSMPLSPNLSFFKTKTASCDSERGDACQD